MFVYKIASFNPLLCSSAFATYECYTRPFTGLWPQQADQEVHIDRNIQIIKASSKTEKGIEVNRIENICFEIAPSSQSRL